jgi:V8-like Glu-specific endopeptidase
MKYLLLLFVVVSQEISAAPMAVYGEDNRIDPYATSNPLLLKMAASTAAMIGKDHMKTVGDNTTITGKSLGDMFKLCPGERFRQQPVAATCSGTLVAPDLIMTAGHCYDMAKMNCRDYSWVFDYRVSQDKQLSVTVPNSKIYSCKSVLLKQFDMGNGLDHALIKLDRPVTDRAFAKIRLANSIKVSEEVVLIGHPSGLPTKIAPGGFVLKVETNSFTTNVDAFSVNSGSGVFNAKTGEIEGILASGRSDYNGFGNCSTVVKYEMKEGNENVSRPLKIQEFLKTYK